MNLLLWPLVSMPTLLVRDERKALAKKLGGKSQAVNAASTLGRVSRGAVRGNAGPATIARRAD